MGVAALGFGDESLHVGLYDLGARLRGGHRLVADEVLAQVGDDVALVGGRTAQAGALTGLGHCSVSYEKCGLQACESSLNCIV